MLDHLIKANKDVAECDALIQRQRDLIAALEASGEDTEAAQNALRILDQTQDAYLDLAERLLDALDKLPPEDDVAE